MLAPGLSPPPSTGNVVDRGKAPLSWTAYLFCPSRPLLTRTSLASLSPHETTCSHIGSRVTDTSRLLADSTMHPPVIAGALPLNPTVVVSAFVVDRTFLKLNHKFHSSIKILTVSEALLMPDGHYMRAQVSQCVVVQLSISI